MLLRNRFPSHPMYGFDDQTRSNLHDESKRAEERYRDALLNKLRPSYTPSEMVRIVQRSQGLIPGGIASEEGAGTMAPETDWEKLQKIKAEMPPSNFVPLVDEMTNLASIPGLLDSEGPETTLGGYGPQGMTVPQTHSYLDNNIGMSNQIVPINDPRYMNEGPETANLQLTPPELARRARLQAEIDRDLERTYDVSLVDQMKQDALKNENFNDPELEQMMLREGIFNRVGNIQRPAYNTANLQIPEADWYKAENVNTIPNREIMGGRFGWEDTRPSNLTGGLTGSPEGLGEAIALRKAEEAKKAQLAQQQQGLLNTNMGEGVGGKYTDDPRFRRDRRNLMGEYLMNFGFSPVFQGQSDWSEVN